MPLILGVSKGGDWGWISEATLLLRDRDRGRVRFVTVERRVRRPCSTWRCSATGSWSAPRRDPDRRRHHQRTDVPAQPVLPGPGHPGLHPARGRASPRSRPPSGWSWSRRWCPGWRRSSVAGRSSALASLITTAGFAALGLVDASWMYATFLLPLVAIAIGMGLSNGPSSSAATAAVPAEPGRRGVRRLQHGAVRRRRGRHRAGGDHLRRGERQPAGRTVRPPGTPSPPGWPPPPG